MDESKIRYYEQNVKQRILLFSSSQQFDGTFYQQDHTPNCKRGGAKKNWGYVMRMTTLSKLEFEEPRASGDASWWDFKNVPLPEGKVAVADMSLKCKCPDDIVTRLTITIVKKDVNHGYERGYVLGTASFTSEGDPNEAWQKRARDLSGEPVKLPGGTYQLRIQLDSTFDKRPRNRKLLRAEVHWFSLALSVTRTVAAHASGPTLPCQALGVGWEVHLRSRPGVRYRYLGHLAAPDAIPCPIPPPLANRADLDDIPTEVRQPLAVLRRLPDVPTDPPAGSQMYGDDTVWTGMGTWDEWGAKVVPTPLAGVAKARGLDWIYCAGDYAWCSDVVLEEGVHLLNPARYPCHYLFARDVLGDERSRRNFDLASYHDPDMSRVVLGSLVEYPTGDGSSLCVELSAGTSLSPDVCSDGNAACLNAAIAELRAALPFASLLFHPKNAAQRRAARRVALPEFTPDYMLSVLDHHVHRCEAPDFPECAVAVGDVEARFKDRRRSAVVEAQRPNTLKDDLLLNLTAKCETQTIRGARVKDLLDYLSFETGAHLTVAIVGGAVRDFLRNVPDHDINDLDIVCAGCDFHTLQKVILGFFSSRNMAFSELAIRISAKHKQFTMLKILKDENDADDLDVALLKAVPVSVLPKNVRKASAGFSTLVGYSFLTDALSRDYTLNAIYVDVSRREVYDPTDALTRDVRGDCVDHLKSAPLALWERQNTFCREVLQMRSVHDIEEVVRRDVGGQFRLLKELLKNTPAAFRHQWRYRVLDSPAPSNPSDAGPPVREDGAAGRRAEESDEAGGDGGGNDGEGSGGAGSADVGEDRQSADVWGGDRVVILGFLAGAEHRIFWLRKMCKKLFGGARTPPQIDRQVRRLLYNCTERHYSRLAEVLFRDRVKNSLLFRLCPAAAMYLIDAIVRAPGNWADATATTRFVFSYLARQLLPAGAIEEDLARTRDRLVVRNAVVELRGLDGDGGAGVGPHRCPMCLEFSVLDVMREVARRTLSSGQSALRPDTTTLHGLKVAFFAPWRSASQAGEGVHLDLSDEEDARIVVVLRKILDIYPPEGELWVYPLPCEFLSATPAVDYLMFICALAEWWRGLQFVKGEFSLFETVMSLVPRQAPRSPETPRDVPRVLLRSALDKLLEVFRLINLDLQNDREIRPHDGGGEAVRDDREGGVPRDVRHGPLSENLREWKTRTDRILSTHSPSYDIPGAVVITVFGDVLDILQIHVGFHADIATHPHLKS
mmetsp:Transcript_21139/g.59490  ORF Transcript_21139/g.59490 Transcript_21139/m.59490 type:complete len:1234 (+) Transcript_21139:155-3856(+)